jgi:hypothetical protein
VIIFCGKSKEDLELERQLGFEENVVNKISELDLLSSHFLQERLPFILEELVCANNDTTDDLWKW